MADQQGPVLGPHARRTIEAGGKRLRPLLVLLAAGPPTGEDAADVLVRAAAAVELVHAATLVHDDVLDRSDLRRGVATVFAEAGRDAAVQTGDALFASAFLLLLENRSADQVRALTKAGGALAQGELIQREDAWNANIDAARYRLRCELKTARLFEAACALGSSAAGRDPEELAVFATEVGIAFQMLDDVLDVEGPPERTGKPRGTDLLDGTVTLPLLVARDRDPEIASIDLRTITTHEQADALCLRIVATGATDEVRRQALDHVARATAALPGDERDAALRAVADSVVARYA